MAWQFDKAVIAQLKGFKVGDPVVVIYRQRGSDKAVTAIGFPGAAATPVYFNTSGQRVELVSGPMVGGACGQAADGPSTGRRSRRAAGRRPRTPAGAARPRARSVMPCEQDRAGARLPHPLLRVMSRAARWRWPALRALARFWADDSGPFHLLGPAVRRRLRRAAARAAGQRAQPRPATSSTPCCSSPACYALAETGGWRRMRPDARRRSITLAVDLGELVHAGGRRRGSTDTSLLSLLLFLARRARTDAARADRVTDAAPARRGRGVPAARRHLGARLRPPRAPRVPGAFSGPVNPGGRPAGLALLQLRDPDDRRLRRRAAGPPGRPLARHAGGGHGAALPRHT